MDEAAGCGIIVLVIVIFALTVGTHNGCQAQPQVATTQAVVQSEKPVLPDFTFGTTEFWCLTATLFATFLISEGLQQGWLSVVSAIIFVALLQWVGTSNPLGYITSHPLHIALAAALYFVIGIVWGFVKWYFFLVDAKNKRIEQQANWLLETTGTHGTVIPPELSSKWKKYETDHPVSIIRKPLARNNKANITRWIGLWPVSMLWALVHDFVKHTATAIYNHLATVYQRMADRVWGDID